MNLASPDLTTPAILDTFKFRVFSFVLVVNMDTLSTSRRSLKPSEDKEDRLRRRREREKARRAAETAEERQERLAKRRERDRARRSTEANNKRRERRGLNLWQRQINAEREARL